MQETATEGLPGSSRTSPTRRSTLPPLERQHLPGAWRSGLVMQFPRLDRQAEHPFQDGQLAIDLAGRNCGPRAFIVWTAFFPNPAIQFTRPLVARCPGTQHAERARHQMRVRPACDVRTRTTASLRGYSYRLLLTQRCGGVATLAPGLSSNPMPRSALSAVFSRRPSRSASPTITMCA